MTIGKLGLWLCVAGLCLGAPSGALAQELDDQTRSAARELATEGSALYQQNDFEGAYDRFNRAFQLVQRPNVGIWAARSLVRAGRWVEASERYLELERFALPADAAAEQTQAVQDAARERRELLARMPSIKVVVEGAEPGSVFVSLNGQMVKPALIGAKQPVNPGKLLVKGVRGEQAVEATVELAEAQFREVRLVFQATGEPTPPTASPAAAQPASRTGDRPGAQASPLRLYGFIGLGVGGAALATGAIFGGLALGDKSDLERACPKRECEPLYHEQNDSYGTKKTVASVGLIGGAVLAAAGAVLIFTAPSGDAGATNSARLRVSGYVAPNGLGVSGAF